MRDAIVCTQAFHQPQQSVLKPHSGQRQTACIRYISALPHRSQIIRSSVSQAAWVFGLATAGTPPGVG